MVTMIKIITLLSLFAAPLLLKSQTRNIDYQKLDNTLTWKRNKVCFEKNIRFEGRTKEELFLESMKWCSHVFNIDNSVKTLNGFEKNGFIVFQKEGVINLGKTRLTEMTTSIALLIKDNEVSFLITDLIIGQYGFLANQKSIENIIKEEDHSTLQYKTMIKSVLATKDLWFLQIENYIGL